MPNLLGMPVSFKPPDYGQGGSFRLSRRFVPAATTLTGILWAFQNPSSKLVIVDRVRLQALQTGAPTAAIEDRFSLNRVTGYTVADTTNSVAITPSAAKQRLRSTSASSGVVIREANTAAGASGGTRVADDNPLLIGALWVPAAVQTASIQPPTVIFDYQPALAHPLVLGVNEGFTVNNDNALGTASGLVLFADFHWTEVVTF